MLLESFDWKKILLSSSSVKFFVNYWQYLSYLAFLCFEYHPQTKLREGNVFTGVPLSTEVGGLIKTKMIIFGLVIM